MNEIQIASSLATLTADSKHMKADIAEIKSLLKEHLAASCTGDCAVGKEVELMKGRGSVYRKITWINLVMILAASAKMYWPG